GVRVAFASATIENTTISGNQGTDLVTGVIADQATLTLRNSTVVNNRGENDLNTGASGPGAVYASYLASITLVNTIVAQNVAGAFGQTVINAGVGRYISAGLPSFSGTMSASYSLIGVPGNSGITTATGNNIF